MVGAGSELMGSGLGTEGASGSSSRTNVLKGSGSVVGGGTHTLFVAHIASGSISVVACGIELGSMAEDLLCLLGHSELE